jgi:hypothetical protein
MNDCTDGVYGAVVRKSAIVDSIEIIKPRKEEGLEECLPEFSCHLDSTA